MKDIDEFLQECNFWLEKIAAAKQREEQALMEKAAVLARVKSFFGGAGRAGRAVSKPKLVVPKNANGFGNAQAKQLQAWKNSKQWSKPNPIKPTQPAAPKAPVSAPKPAAGTPSTKTPTPAETPAPAGTPEAPAPATTKTTKPPAETPAPADLPPVPKEVPKPKTPAETPAPGAAGDEAGAAAAKTPGWFGRHPLLTAGLGATAGGLGVHLFSSQPSTPQQVVTQPTSEQIASYYNAYAPQRPY